MSLQNTPPPRLPDVEKDVDKGYVTGLLRALRLYFNGLFTLMGNLITGLETLQTDVTALQHTVFQADYYRNDGATAARNVQEEILAWNSAIANTSLGSWNTTYGRITPNRAGWYWAKIAFNFGSSAISFLQVSLAKNGSLSHSDLRGENVDYSYMHAIASGLIYCNGTTDYISGFVRQDNSTASGKAVYDASAIIDVFLVRPD